MRNAITLFVQFCIFASVPATFAEPAPTPAPPLRSAIYKPPPWGAPNTRTGGGTRGSANPAAALVAIVPSHTGLSATDQPNLYWSTSRSINLPAELTLNDSDSTTPLVEIRLPPPIIAGDHAFSLKSLKDSKDRPIRLRPGVEYQWFVTLVKDPQNPSANEVAGGGVIFQPMADNVLGNPLRRATEMAGDSYWYDAIDTLETALQLTPHNTEILRMLERLEGEVGLNTNRN